MNFCIFVPRYERVRVLRRRGGLRTEEDLIAPLAFHYLRAEDAATAKQMYIAAGRVAVAKGQFAEAARLFDVCLGLFRGFEADGGGAGADGGNGPTLGGSAAANHAHGGGGGGPSDGGGGSSGGGDHGDGEQPGHHRRKGDSDDDAVCEVLMWLAHLTLRYNVEYRPRFMGPWNAFGGDVGGSNGGGAADAGKSSPVTLSLRGLLKATTPRHKVSSQRNATLGGGGGGGKMPHISWHGQMAARIDWDSEGRRASSGPNPTAPRRKSFLGFMELPGTATAGGAAATQRHKAEARDEAIFVAEALLRRAQQVQSDAVLVRALRR